MMFLTILAVPPFPLNVFWGLFVSMFEPKLAKANFLNLSL